MVFKINSNDSKETENEQTPNYLRGQKKQPENLANKSSSASMSDLKTSEQTEETNVKKCIKNSSGAATTSAAIYPITSSSYPSFHKASQLFIPPSSSTLSVTDAAVDAPIFTIPVHSASLGASSSATSSKYKQAANISRNQKRRRKSGSGGENEPAVVVVTKSSNCLCLNGMTRRNLLIFGLTGLFILVVCAISVTVLATRDAYRLTNLDAKQQKQLQEQEPANKLINTFFGSANVDRTNHEFVNQWPPFKNSPSSESTEQQINSNSGGGDLNPSNKNHRNTNSFSSYLNNLNSNHFNPFGIVPNKNQYDDQKIAAAKQPSPFSPTNYKNSFNPFGSNSNNAKANANGNVNSERNVFNWIKNVLSDTFYGNIDTQNCGMRIIRNTRIMNGKESVPHSWPWAISISLEGPKELVPHACGGTLISRRYAITAAHCVLKSSIYGLVGQPVNKPLKFSTAERMMRVNVGLHDRIVDINPRNVYGVESVNMHPEFDPVTFRNDVALVRLDRDIDPSSNVGYICLTKSTQVTPGDLIYAIGWGYYENSRSKASRYLREVDLVVQSKNTCLIPFIDHDQFCAGNIYSKKDTCNGDSGGPLMKLVNEKWTMMGIVSNGDASCTGTGIYTNVPFYYDWIVKNMRN